MNVQATISIALESRRALEAALEALIPESIISSNPRSMIKIVQEDDILYMIFRATDTSALRASINSYLRFAFLSKRVIEIIEQFS